MSDPLPILLVPKLFALVVRLFAVIVAASVLFGVWHMLTPQPKYVKFSQIFELNFEGLSQQRFPDGTPFLLSEVVGRPVLAKVHEDLALLATHDLSLLELSNALQIAPYSADYQRLVQTARSQVKSETLEGDLSRISQQLGTDLKAAQSGAMQLSLVLPQSRALEDAVAFEILESVVRAWAVSAVNDRGVLGLDVPIYTAIMFDASRFKLLDYLVAIELLIENIDLVQANIERVQQVPNASNIRDTQTQFNLEDTAKALVDVAQIDLQLLADPIRQFGLSQDPNTMRLLYQRRMAELKIARDSLQDRVQATQDVTNIGLASDEGLAQSWSQLGDSFIDRLIDLAAQGEDEASRQALTNQILEYQQQLVSLAQEEAELLDVLARLDRFTANTRSASQVTFEDALQVSVDQSFVDILSQLTHYTNIVERIHTQLGLQASGGIDQLVRTTSSGRAITTDKLWQRHDLIRFAAFITGVGILSLFMLLAFGLWRHRKQ